MMTAKADLLRAAILETLNFSAQERWLDLFESVSSVFSFQVEREPSKRRALLEHMQVEL